MFPVRPVLVVRHGQSVWNAERRWQGRADSPLSDLGRAAAAELARDLIAVGPGSLWSSTAGRAVQTAEIIGSVLGLPVTTDERLIERDVGGWQGLTAPEIELRWPGHLATRRWPDDAERPGAVVSRAGAALRSIAAATRHDARPPVVVSHGGVIRSLLRTEPGRDGAIPNLGGAWFHVHPDSASVVPGELFNAPAMMPADDGESDTARL